MDMVNEGHEQGVLESSEAEMITNIFEFDDKEAGDIMTHRKNIVALDGSMSLREAAHFVLKEDVYKRQPLSCHWLPRFRWRGHARCVRNLHRALS